MSNNIPKPLPSDDPGCTTGINKRLLFKRKHKFQASSTEKLLMPTLYEDRVVEVKK